jgi:methionyl-tRNA formyltransferase
LSSVAGGLEDAHGYTSLGKWNDDRTGSEVTARATLDLFVGSAVGLAYAASIPPERVGRIYVADHDSAAQVRALGHEVNVYPCPIEAAARLCFSVHFSRVLPARVLALYEGCYNLHAGYLPHGKGMLPLFWAIWAREPAGVSLHVMSPELDGGPILHQVPVEVSETETMESLRTRLSAVEEQILAEVTPKLLSGQRLENTYASIDQTSLQDVGTFHTRRDFEKMRDDPPLASMSALDLIRLMRALHLTGFPGVQTEADGRPAWLNLVFDLPAS